MLDLLIGILLGLSIGLLIHLYQFKKHLKQQYDDIVKLNARIKELKQILSNADDFSKTT